MTIIEAVVPKGCEKNLGVLAYQQGYRDGQKRFYLTRASVRDGVSEPPAPKVPDEFSGHEDAALAYLTAEATGYELALNNYERLMRGGRPRPAAPTRLILGLVACVILAGLAGCCSTCTHSTSAIGDKKGEKKLLAAFRKGWPTPAEPKAEIVPIDELPNPADVRRVLNVDATKPLVIEYCTEAAEKKAPNKIVVDPAPAYQADNLNEIKTRSHYFQGSCGFRYCPPAKPPATPAQASGACQPAQAGDSINPHQFPPAGTVYTMPECSSGGG